MKKYLIIALVLFFSIYMFGCRKKEVAMEEVQEPMSLEALSTATTPIATTPETKAQSSPQITSNLAPQSKLELTLPPAGPYQPTAIEIQTALKNANLYAGEIDGKIGPQTKKAIEDFQKANGLQVDGKVGPKTWGLLSSYLNPPAAEPKTKKKR